MGFGELTKTTSAAKLRHCFWQKYNSLRLLGLLEIDIS